MAPVEEIRRPDRLVDVRQFRTGRNASTSK